MKPIVRGRRLGAVRAEPCACFYLISSQSPSPAVDCFIVRSNCCSCYRVVQMCFVSTARPVDQLCLPLPPPPIRGGLLGARTNVRAEPLQSPAPAASDVQSPAPALHAQSRMASSSAGPSRDPEWLLQTRTRQMQHRRGSGSGAMADGGNGRHGNGGRMGRGIRPCCSEGLTRRLEVGMAWAAGTSHPEGCALFRLPGRVVRSLCMYTVVCRAMRLLAMSRHFVCCRALRLRRAHPNPHKLRTPYAVIQAQ